MPSPFLANPTLAPSSSSDLPRDDSMAAGSSSSSCPSRHPEIWNYLWIPLLISFSKDLALAKAQSGILLPGQLENEAAVSGGVPSCPAADPKLNFRPVIGILGHPGDGASGRLNNASNASYIATSYVKFVESAGARVIPLIYNEPREVLFEKLNMVNGVLFTGGWTKTGLYYETVKAIFKFS
ncbi:hypothetical protein BT93_C1326 [Corymbia citriodora subsp. variegata]|nr:hypothetical protein BT93_C1326 [Corymbia citriodora subsp. variegata]